MNIIILWILITLLIVIILLLSIAILYFVKKATYLSKKEKDFINFSIDMYIDYAEELKINSENEHNLIVKELKKIKEKLFNVK